MKAEYEVVLYIKNPPDRAALKGLVSALEDP
ncbi:MAG TPA: arsenate reductase (glutaredoxin), partial [Verrucomicrobiales bacterium]|nr:arsenate reductase (glutaredoxin) [Verrucomicrobiales bacterium]